MQAPRLHAFQAYHRLADAVGTMGGTGAEYADGLVTAQTRRAHLQAWFVFQCLVEKEQQPDVADLFQALHGFALIERRQQFQHAACGGSQVWLAGDGELFLEAGTDDTDRRNLMLHADLLSDG